MLNPRFTDGSQIIKTPTGWRLQIPAGDTHSYRLAQLDNYSNLSRQHFPISPPALISLKCRVSASHIPGTWGFGLWNDPFAISIGLKGMNQRLPILPNACWFFHASNENHLSFHNHLRGSGFLSQVFHSPKFSSLLLAPAILGLPLLLIKPISKWLRAACGKIIHEDSQKLDLDVTDWHSYSLEWQANGVGFLIDNELVFETNVAPAGPLGVVIWIDNQFAAWTAEGKIAMGSLAQTSESWLEIEQLRIE